VYPALDYRLLTGDQPTPDPRGTYVQITSINARIAYQRIASPHYKIFWYPPWSRWMLSMSTSPPTPYYWFDQNILGGWMSPLWDEDPWVFLGEPFAA
jgi:hypothetical protein